MCTLKERLNPAWSHVIHTRSTLNGIGLKQNEVMSPVMCSNFVKEIELQLPSKVESNIQIKIVMLIMSLFADDMAIFANTSE